MPQVTAVFGTHLQMDIALPGGVVAGAIPGYSSGLQEHGAFVQGMPTNASPTAYTKKRRRMAFIPDHTESGAGTGILLDLLSEGQLLGAHTYVSAAIVLEDGYADTGGMGLLEQHFQDVYYRVYAVPRMYNVPNPVIGENNQFYLFNGFLSAQTCTGITALNDGGLTMDLAPSFPVGRHQVVAGNIVIDTSADATTLAEYLFDFGVGGIPDMFFIAKLVHYLQIIGEVPIREEWLWNTTVLTSHDGSEQRMALRSQPRTNLRCKALIESDAARKQLYDRLHETTGKHVVLGMFQYATQLTADSAIGTSQLYFDNDMTDLRDNDYVAVLRTAVALADEQQFIVNIGTRNAAGALTSNPLTVELLAGDIIAPGAVGVLKDGGGFGMGSITGNVNINFEGTSPRSTFEDPQSVAVINQYAGYNILDLRPLTSRGSTTEKFFAAAKRIDYDMGRVELKKSWLNTKVSGKREYRIQRSAVGTAEMDYFTDFLQQADGRRNPFLLPTFRSDFTLTTPITQNMTIFRTSDMRFLDFWMFETFRHIRFTSSLGNTVDRTIGTVTSYSQTELEISLLSPTPEDAEWDNTVLVSFLNVVRLATDKVSLKHYPLHTVLTLAVATTDSVDPSLEV